MPCQCPCDLPGDMAVLLASGRIQRLLGFSPRARAMPLFPRPSTPRCSTGTPSSLSNNSWLQIIVLNGLRFQLMLVTPVDFLRQVCHIYARTYLISASLWCYIMASIRGIASETSTFHDHIIQYSLLAFGHSLLCSTTCNTTPSSAAMASPHPIQ